MRRIEKSAVPGLDSLITGIGRAKNRNKIILSIVIAFCVVFMMYLKGIYVVSAGPGN